MDKRSMVSVSDFMVSKERLHAKLDLVAEIHCSYYMPVENTENSVCTCDMGLNTHTHTSKKKAWYTKFLEKQDFCQK